MNRVATLTGALAVSAGLVSGVARADLLTFETAPDGSLPVDNAELTAPYAIPGGTVQFFFDMNDNDSYDAGVDLNPVFERVGVDPERGFASNFHSTQDRARPGYEGQLGTFFLRHPTIPFGRFIAHYDTVNPITELSGEIWDIDGFPGVGTERWLVEVLNGAGGVLASLLSPDGVDASPSSLDSLPWTFAFRDLPPGVEKIRFSFVGTKLTGHGLGFNNFSPDVAVPEPSGIALAFLGLGTLATRRRRTSGVEG